MKLDCGIQKARIDAWLADELALAYADGRWLFHCNGATCSVATVELENRVLGAFSLERTELRAEGGPVAIEEFMRLFTLRFMSAGG